MKKIFVTLAIFCMMFSLKAAEFSCYSSENTVYVDHKDFRLSFEVPEDFSLEAYEVDQEEATCIWYKETRQLPGLECTVIKFDCDPDDILEYVRASGLTVSDLFLWDKNVIRYFGALESESFDFGIDELGKYAISGFFFFHNNKLFECMMVDSPENMESLQETMETFLQNCTFESLIVEEEHRENSAMEKNITHPENSHFPCEKIANLQEKVTISADLPHVSMSNLELDCVYSPLN